MKSGTLENRLNGRDARTANRYSECSMVLLD